MQVLILDKEPAVRLWYVNMVGVHRQSLRSVHRQNHVPRPFGQRPAHSSLLPVEHQVVVARKTVPDLGLAWYTTFCGSHGHGVQPVSDGAGGRVSLDADRQVHVVLVRPVVVVETGYVPLVLVVVLGTAAGRLQVGSFAVNLGDSQVPPGRVLLGLEPEVDIYGQGVGLSESGPVDGYVIINVDVDVGDVGTKRVKPALGDGAAEPADGDLGVDVVGGDGEGVGRVALAIHKGLHTEIEEVDTDLTNPGKKVDPVEAVPDGGGYVGVVGVLEVGDLPVGLVPAVAGEHAAGPGVGRHVMAEMAETRWPPTLTTAVVVRCALAKLAFDRDALFFGQL